MAGLPCTCSTRLLTMPLCPPYAAVGSAALPWSHQRPPASSLIGQRLGTASPAAAGEAAAQASRHTAAAVGEGGASAATAGEGAVAGQPGEAAYQMEGDTGSDGDAARQPAPAASATTRRHPLLHPGYFTRARGPSYTPAPPEALIDAREQSVARGSAAAAHAADAVLQAAGEVPACLPLIPAPCLPPPPQARVVPRWPPSCAAR